MKEHSCTLRSINYASMISKTSGIIVKCQNQLSTSQIRYSIMYYVFLHDRTYYTVEVNRMVHGFHDSKFHRSE